MGKKRKRPSISRTTDLDPKITKKIISKQLGALSEQLQGSLDQQHRWGETLTDLSRKIEDLARETEDLRGQSAERHQLAVQLEEERDGIDQELKGETAIVNRLSKEIQELTQKQKKQRVKSAQLESERNKLKADVGRLQQLASEYAEQISRFRSDKAQMVRKPRVLSRSR